MVSAPIGMSCPFLLLLLQSAGGDETTKAWYIQNTAEAININPTN